jgi:hypothetical protein
VSPASAVDERGYGGVMADEGSPAVSGARHVSFGPIEIDVGSIGDARLKRLVYPPGMRWSVDVKPLVGTDLCEHAHAGFLIEGELRFEFPDGCTLDFVAPAVVEVVPGHDAQVTGDGRAVLIEVDFEGATTERLGLAPAHRHD